MKFFRMSILLVAIFCLTQPASAKKSEDPMLNKVWLFGGLDFGGAMYWTDIATEADKKGFQGDAKGLASYYLSPVVVDAGFGWMYNYLNGSEGVILEDTVKTWSAFSEVAARYRLGNFQLGPVLDIAFGTDLNFGSRRGNDSVVGLMGAQLVYELPHEKWALRFVLQGLTDLLIADRQIALGMFGIQVGLPVWGGEPEPTPTPRPTPMPTPVPTPEVIATPPPTPIPEVVVKISLDLIYFDFDSDELKPAAKKMLKEMGAFLASHPDIWDIMDVGGHTDSRGSFAYNMKLSLRRAESVKEGIVAGGVDPDRLRPAGYAYSQPLVNGDTEEAYAQNRRVELAFQKVRDKKTLAEGLEEIKKKLR